MIRFLVHTNEEGFIQDYKLDPSVDESVYLGRFENSIIVDEVDLPDREKADLWTIVNKTVIIDGAKVLAAKQVELVRLIDEDVVRKIAEPFTIEGTRKKDLVLAMTTMEDLNAVDIDNL